MALARSVTLLLVSGSLRAGSTNSAVLRSAAELVPEDVEAVIYDGLGDLPHFSPDDDAEGHPVHGAVAAMRRELVAADALLICTPEYAGALPGALKNMLEWTIGDAGTYNKPVAWINAAGPAAPSGAADAHDSLRKVLGFAGAEVVDKACRRIPITRQALSLDGRIADPEACRAIRSTLEALAAHARGRQAAE